MEKLSTSSENCPNLRSVEKFSHRKFSLSKLHGQRRRLVINKLSLVRNPSLSAVCFATWPNDFSHKKRPTSGFPLIFVLISCPGYSNIFRRQKVVRGIPRLSEVFQFPCKSSVNKNGHSGKGPFRVLGPMF